MEIKFKDKLQYQVDAINSVIDLFEGQSILSSNISIMAPGMVSSFEGKGNLFDLSPQDLEENFKNVQQKNGLPINDKLESYDFTVEMETGTGKTYVYLRTILELNIHYGFSKFVIVVPSLAIKEGVKKTIDITRDHFAKLYNNISYTDFIFDSSNMSDLKNFMEDDNIQIMIITIQAFNKDKNKIRQKTESGIIPLSYITKTNPIVIVDEPQSTIGRKKGKEAVSDLNPLFTLQYSATPKDTTNLIYQLNAVDAYNKNLVKKIEVNAFDAADYQGKPYIRLNNVKLDKRNGKRTAELTIVKNTPLGLNTAVVKNIKRGDRLSVDKISNNKIYNDYIVDDVIVREGDKHILFDNGQKIYIGQSINDINQEGVRRAQIEETIREHLNKELKLSKKNIKVLSLFFIDEVANYREYDEEGSHKGKYAKWFEESYKKIISEDRYKKLPKHILDFAPEEVHDGYFSKDKQKFTDTSGKTLKDNKTYELIMRDKEKLLDPKNRLRFIFSHSALKEGWDNPNVFQICTFIETKSDLSKRQKIGRGLRLCVDGEGNRVDETYGDGEEFKDINKLTVLANESFDNFAKSLQKEMEADGIRFNVLNKKDFKGVNFITSDGEHKKLDGSDSEKIWGSLYEQGLISFEGLINKKWDKALIEGTVEIPEKYENAREEIIRVVSEKSATDYIKNVKDRVTIKLNDDKFNSVSFDKLWDKIKYKSRYSVDFDTEELIEKCVKDMEQSLKYIQKASVTHTKTEVTMRNSVDGIARYNRQHFIDIENNEIPNIVKDLQDHTHLTRKTIIEILLRSNERDNTLEKLLINPTEFFNRTLEIIQENLNHLVVETIEYHKIDDEFVKTKFKQSFEDWVEDNDYLKSKLVFSNKSIYEYIKCDSITEIKFAQDLEDMDDIELFIKLPNWFTIKTPVGEYNPDWAITVNVSGRKETYYVIETKGSSKQKELRQREKDKIDCACKHFDLVSDVDYGYVVSYEDFSQRFIYD